MKTAIVDNYKMFVYNFVHYRSGDESFACVPGQSVSLE